VAHIIGAPELIKYDRFRTVTDRSRNNGELSSEIVARLAGETVDVWIERFRAAGVPVTRVAGLEEAVQTQTVAERRIFANLDGVPQVRLPWVVDGATVPWARPAPKLGEHTAEVLLELGFVEGSTEREGAPHAVPDQ
jgi:crotonobetainyl-CoA:carnitine CoA-transferase CaiB-like acyl-CoA transferase